MRYDKSKLTFKDNLKSVCFGMSAIKTVFIPITLIVAQLLSDVVIRATEGDVATVIKNSLIILILMSLSTTLQIVSNVWMRKQQSKSVNKCKIDFMEMLLKNPLNKLFRAEHGELVENLNNDIKSITRRFTQLLPNIISGVIISLVYITFLTFKSPLVAISLLAIALLQIFPPLIVKRHMQVSYDECRKMEAKITDHVIRGVDGFAVIKLYGLKQWWQAKLSSYHEAYIHIGRKADATAMAQRSMYKLLDNILKFGTYILMGIYVVRGYCSIDVAVQGIYLSSGLFAAVNLFFSTISEMAVSHTAEKRINKWILQGDTRIGMTTSNIDRITLKDIYCSYEKNNVINGISYQFERDKNYLLVGSNGAGKTTLIHLLSGLILPDSGEIAVGGNRNSDTFYKSLLYTPQNDPEYGFSAQTLFDMFGDESQKICNLIARRLGLIEENINHKLICELSGGERKKVFLSIAFAIQPEWLLLDEPTNNLDSYGKKVVCELVQERSGIIIISHDPALHGITNNIVKIENGRIA